MTLCTPLRCFCGNTNQDRFETIIGGYSAPRRDGWRGAIVLKGHRCMDCDRVLMLADGETTDRKEG